jgi:hypothetical protein
VKGFLEGYFSMHKPFVNVVQHLRDFGCFEMNKRDLSRQRQHILLAEEEILHEIGNHPRTRTSCKSFGSLSVCSLVYPKGPRFMLGFSNKADCFDLKAKTVYSNVNVLFYNLQVSS